MATAQESGLRENCTSRLSERAEAGRKLHLPRLYTAEAGNVGGGKGPQFKTDAIRSEGRWRLGNLSTPKSVQKLQMALHAKAKA